MPKQGYKQSKEHVEERMMNFHRKNLYTGRGNKKCLLCGKKVEDLLFCDKCRQRSVGARIGGFARSKYWKKSEYHPK